MPDDEKFDPKLRVPSAITYRNPQSRRRLRLLTEVQFAVHLPTLFPWITVKGWQFLPTTATTMELGDIRADVDLWGLFPTMRAILNTDPLANDACFADVLCVTIERMRAVMPRVDEHYLTFEPRFIKRADDTFNAVMHIENAYRGSHVYRMPIQMGHRFGGYTPAYAVKHFEKDRVVEFGLDAVHTGIVLAVHYLAHGTVPLLRADSPGSVYDPAGSGEQHTDGTSWHSDPEDNLLAGDWHWLSNRARSKHGTCTGFMRHRR